MNLQHYHPDDDTQPPGVWILTTVVGVLGLAANLLAMVVFISRRSLLTFGTDTNTMNTLILNQVILDFLASLCLVVNSTSTVQDPKHDLSDTIVNRVYCVLWISKLPQWTFYFNSVYNVAAMTRDRHVALYDPINYMTLHTKRRLYLLIIGIWCAGLIVELGVHAPTSYIENGTCYFYANRSIEHGATVGCALFVLIYVLPFSYILFTNVKLILRLRSGNIAAGYYRDMLTTVITISVVLLICWSVNAIYFFCYNVGVNLSLQVWSYHIILNLAFANMFINPIIYVFRYSVFSDAASALFCSILYNNDLEGSPSDDNSVINQPFCGQINNYP